MSNHQFESLHHLLQKKYPSLAKHCALAPEDSMLHRLITGQLAEVTVAFWAQTHDARLEPFPTICRIAHQARRDGDLPSSEQ